MNQGQEVAAAAVPADEEQQQASTKRLKYSEPDLEITCKGRDGSEKTFERYSSVMAWNSKYFDTLLASEMQESITKQVTLEDVSPETFELAMELIDDMACASKASVTDFVKVASFYNRFDFQNGLKRCIKALVEFMELWHKNLNEEPPFKSLPPKKGEMENILATICIAAETEAQELVQICIQFLSRKFFTHPSLFDADRLRRIQGFLVNHEICLESFFIRYYDRPGYGRPDANDPEFPNRLAGKLQSTEFSRCLESMYFHLCLKVAGKKKKTFTLQRNADGFFGVEDDSVHEGSRFRDVRLFQIDGTYKDEMECERFDWCVSFEFRGTTILLALPQSRNTPNPAGEGWKKVKASVNGNRFKITSLELYAYVDGSDEEASSSDDE